MNPNLEAKLKSNLALLYGPEAGKIVENIANLVENYHASIPETRAYWNESDSLLITYGDSLQEKNTLGLEINSYNLFLPSKKGR